MAISLIKLYQILFSSFLGTVIGTRCRFTPTCACYAREAFRQNGFIIGLLKTLGRVCRCQPFGGHGYDPVEHKTN